jgi:hypothetical protein
MKVTSSRTLLCLLIVIFIFTFCSNQNPVNTDCIETSDDSEIISDVSTSLSNWNSLENIIKGFAKCFDDPSCKILLRSSILNSSNQEKKIDFKEFLHS